MDEFAKAAEWIYETRQVDPLLDRRALREDAKVNDLKYELKLRNVRPRDGGKGLENLKKELEQWFAAQEESIAKANKVMQHHDEGFEKLMIAVRERNEKSGLSISPPNGGKVSLFTTSSSRSSVASKSSGSGVTTRSSSSTRSLLAAPLSTGSERKGNQRLHGNRSSSHSASPPIPDSSHMRLEFGDGGDDITAVMTQRDSTAAGFHRTVPVVFNKDAYLTQRRGLITSPPNEQDQIVSAALSHLNILPPRLASLTAAAIGERIFGCKPNGEPRYKEFESDLQNSSRTIATFQMNCRRVVAKSEVTMACCRCRNDVPVNKAVSCYR